MDILLGLLEPQQGKVTVDGVDIRTNLPGWYAKVGYVPQMIFMLDDTIRNNVAYGVDEKEIDEQQVWYALKEAQMDEFVRGLPEGLDTSIGERGVRRAETAAWDCQGAVYGAGNHDFRRGDVCAG